MLFTIELTDHEVHDIEQQLCTLIRISQRFVNISEIKVTTNSVLICTLVVVYVFLWIINTGFSENQSHVISSLLRYVHTALVQCVVN